jgi:uncharacterized protein YjlB
MMTVASETYLFADGANVPNNPTLPLRLYRQAFAFQSADREQHVIAHLAGNDWGAAWVNGIYDFHHYHATAHEVLVITRGWADVMFGGPQGRVIRAEAGDAVIIPAGVGHCRTEASPDLTVVGAYPAGQENYDLKRATREDHARALKEIANVGLPARNPITGTPKFWTNITE